MADQEEEFVLLDVNMSRPTAELLRAVMERHHLRVAEAMRRIIAKSDQIDREIAADGSKLQVSHPDGRTKEIVIFH